VQVENVRCLQGVATKQVVFLRMFSRARNEAELKSLDAWQMKSIYE
jgi:hypothetical protein